MYAMQRRGGNMDPPGVRAGPAAAFAAAVEQWLERQRLDGRHRQQRAQWRQDMDRRVLEHLDNQRSIRRDLRLTDNRRS
jgi:hypothetical protein